MAKSASILKTANSKVTNPHMGSSFDDFLKEDGIFEEVQARALKRALSEQLDDAMQTSKLTKVVMARRMATSRSQLDRVLDPANLSIQLDTLIKAAHAVGKTVEIRLKQEVKSATARASVSAVGV
jgi:antitoxin HicB